MMRQPPTTPGHRPGTQAVPFPSDIGPLQAAAEMRLDNLQMLFGILVSVDGFADAQLLREVFHNASQQLSDAQALYRHALAQAQRRTNDDN